MHEHFLSIASFIYDSYQWVLVRIINVFVAEIDLLRGRSTLQYYTCSLLRLVYLGICMARSTGALDALVKGLM